MTQIYLLFHAVVVGRASALWKDIEFIIGGRGVWIFSIVLTEMRNY